MRMLVWLVFPTGSRASVLLRDYSTRRHDIAELLAVLEASAIGADYLSGVQQDAHNPGYTLITLLARGFCYMLLPMPFSSHFNVQYTVQLQLVILCSTYA